MCAATTPWWREREHLRRAARGYWWNVSTPVKQTTSTSTPVLAESAGIEEALVYLQASVRRTKMVEPNYRAIGKFAAYLHLRDTKLIVFEGVLHPRAMRICDPALRKEARERLAAMAIERGFHFVPADALPVMDETDFYDAYHLNELGRERFTQFVAEYLATSGVDRIAAPPIADEEQCPMQRALKSVCSTATTL